jgi:hypothetical protein
MPEKKECKLHQNATDTPKGIDYCVNCVAVETWNACLDACRLASVVSEEELAKVINKFWVEWEAPSNEVYSKELAHAIAKYINGKF